MQANGYESHENWRDEGFDRRDNDIDNYIVEIAFLSSNQ